MAIKPLKVCNWIGCNQFTRKRYCEKHAIEYEEKRKQQKDSRESAAKRGYDVTWNKVRKIKLSLNPYCEKCGGWKKLTIHHIIPIKEGGERLDVENLMTLCRDCHEKIHGRKYETI